MLGCVMLGVRRHSQRLPPSGGFATARRGALKRSIASARGGRSEAPRRRFPLPDPCSLSMSPRLSNLRRSGSRSRGVRPGYPLRAWPAVTGSSSSFPCRISTTSLGRRLPAPRARAPRWRGHPRLAAHLNASARRRSASALKRLSGMCLGWAVRPHPALDPHPALEGGQRPRPALSVFRWSPTRPRPARSS